MENTCLSDSEYQLATKKYVHLMEFLDDDDCKKLSDGLKQLVIDKRTKKDHQCPISEAIYGAEIFDDLLLRCKDKLEDASGRKLLPTYSYARLYVHGEELPNHLDRESCEISVTITLGFDGDVWPIYMSDFADKREATKISMKIGDAVLYRGTEKFHWREKYTEGEWQAQVFLHYVDANGNFADWVFDKRKALNL
jgi:hypothetical protein